MSYGYSAMHHFELKEMSCGDIGLAITAVIFYAHCLQSVTDVLQKCRPVSQPRVADTKDIGKFSSVLLNIAI